MFRRLCALLLIVSTRAKDPVPLATVANEGRFHLIKSSAGLSMCALDQPSQMLGSVRSQIECCSMCRQNPECQSLNFRADLSRCEVFEFQIQTMNHISNRCQLAALGTLSANAWKSAELATEEEPPTATTRRVSTTEKGSSTTVEGTSVAPTLMITSRPGMPTTSTLQTTTTTRLVSTAVKGLSTTAKGTSVLSTSTITSLPSSSITTSASLTVGKPTTTVSTVSSTTRRGGLPGLNVMIGSSTHALTTANGTSVASTSNAQSTTSITTSPSKRPSTVSSPANVSVLILRNDLPGSNALFFNRSLAQFKNSFGSPNARYWIGLDTLHNLTRSKCMIRFDLQLTNGTWFYAQYSYFTVGDSSTGYVLNITGYSGNLYDAMAYSNGRKFTTYDADFDNYSGNCAQYFGGGFWHNFCVYAHITTGPLNGGRFQWDDGGSKMNLLNVTEVRLTI